jgi:hypothetical protein
MKEELRKLWEEYKEVWYENPVGLEPTLAGFWEWIINSED